MKSFHFQKLLFLQQTHRLIFFTTFPQLLSFIVQKIAKLELTQPPTWFFLSCFSEFPLFLLPLSLTSFTISFCFPLLFRLPLLLHGLSRAAILSLWLSVQSMPFSSSLLLFLTSISATSQQFPFQSASLSFLRSTQ